MVILWLATQGLATFLIATQPVGGSKPLSLSRALFATTSTGTLSGFDWSWGGVDQLGALSRWSLLLVLAVGAKTLFAVPTLALLRLSRRLGGTAEISVRRALAAPAAGVVLVVLTGFFLGERSVFQILWTGLGVLAGGGEIAGVRESATAETGVFWWLLTPCSFLGLFGPLLLARWLAGPSLGPQVRRTLTWSAACFLALAGLFCLVLGEFRPDMEAATSGVAYAIDTRSSGFLDAAKQMPRPVQVLLVPVMLLGAGGVGGGLGAMGFGLLVAGVWRQWRGQPVRRSFGIGATWLALLITAFVATASVLSSQLPELPVDRIAILVAAACGQTGVSVDPVSAVGDDAYVLAIAMVTMRLLGCGMLWLAASLGDEDVIQA